jgi:spore coat polysaccharide biosynthesis protein SpsF
MGRVGAIVQARVSSTRLPRKVLLPLEGRPVLWHVLDRIGHAKKVDIVILATSTLPEDAELKKIADEFGIPTFFGSMDDVLARYYHAAERFRIDPIVRITSDCPMIDPEIVDEVAQGFLDGGYDHYGLSGSFPDGLDTEVLSFRALEIAFKEACLPSEREHVGAGFFEKNKDRIKIGGYRKFSDKGDYRWTIDEPEDYEFLKAVFRELYVPGRPFSYRDVFSLLERRPELRAINAHIIRNEGYLKSLREDEKFLRKRREKTG